MRKAHLHFLTLIAGPRRPYPIRITEKRISALVKRGYLGADERDDLNAIGQAMTLFLWDSLREIPKPKKKQRDRNYRRQKLDKSRVIL
jgi:hypothetical protein